MHVKQTDMSESLKGPVVPLLGLHQAWEAGVGGGAGHVSGAPAEL